MVVGCGRLDSPEAKLPPLQPLLVREWYTSPRLVLPISLSIGNGWVAVTDAGLSPAVHVVSSADSSVRLYTGSRGDGPGQFRSVYSSAIQSDSLLWINDLTARRLTSFRLPSAVSGPALYRKSIALSHAPALTSPIWFGDSVVVSPGFLEQGRLAAITPEGRLLRTFGALPDSVEGVPPAVVQHAYMGVAARHPAKPLLVVAVRHADQLEIHALDQGSVRKVRVHGGFQPRYRVRTRYGARVMATDGNLRFGYVDVAATERAIYALYSGRKRSEAPGAAHLARYVYVFDWQGRVRQRFTLQTPVLGITVDERGHRLFFIRREPEPAVLVATMPPLPARSH